MDLSAHIGPIVYLLTMCESSERGGDTVIRVNDRVAAGFESYCSPKTKKAGQSSFPGQSPTYLRGRGQRRRSAPSLPVSATSSEQTHILSPSAHNQRLNLEVSLSNRTYERIKISRIAYASDRHKVLVGFNIASYQCYTRLNLNLLGPKAVAQS